MRDFSRRILWVERFFLRRYVILSNISEQLCDFSRRILWIVYFICSIAEHLRDFSRHILWVGRIFLRRHVVLWSITEPLRDFSRRILWVGRVFLRRHVVFFSIAAYCVIFLVVFYGLKGFFFTGMLVVASQKNCVIFLVVFYMDWKVLFCNEAEELHDSSRLLWVERFFFAGMSNFNVFQAFSFTCMLHRSIFARFFTFLFLHLCMFFMSHSMNVRTLLTGGVY